MRTGGGRMEVGVRAIQCACEGTPAQARPFLTRRPARARVRSPSPHATTPNNDTATSVLLAPNLR